MGSFGGWDPGVVVSVGRLTSRPLGGMGKGWWIGGGFGGEGAVTEPALGCFT